LGPGAGTTLGVEPLDPFELFEALASAFWLAAWLVWLVGALTPRLALAGVVGTVCGALGGGGLLEDDPMDVELIAPKSLIPD
jgi:hypothetical protein